jgi:hypothetical protein
VPAAWADVDTESVWGDGETDFGVAIWASVDYDLWYSGWDTPGMFFGASAVLPAFETVGSILDAQDFSFACTYDGQYDYSDELYVGAYNLWVDCDGGDTLLVDLVAETPASDVLMNVQVVVVTDADLEALDTVLATFVVDDVALAQFSGVATNTSTIVDFATLFPGDCFNSYDTPVEDVVFGTDVEVVSCDLPHQAEVYGNFFIPDAESTAFPGLETVSEVGAEYCFTEFSPYVGASYEESALDYWWYYPGEADWNNGLGFVMCTLVDFVGEDLVGSAFGSGW